MSEAEILYQFSLFEDRLWTTLQWWVSISLGLVAIGHFGGKKLNIVLLTLLIGLYVAFSVFISVFIAAVLSRMAGAAGDLLALQEADISLTSQAVLQIMGGSSGLSITLLNSTILICVLGTFVGSIYYLVYSYRRTRP